MRIPPMPQVCFAVLWALLILITGCSNPSSQTLASLTVTATPATVSVGGSSVLKAVAHLSDGTSQDVTSSTQWTISNPTLATMKNGALTAVAPGAVTVQAAYVEATPAGTSPASASTTPENLSGSTQVTISSAPSTPSSNIPTISWAAPAAIAYGTALSAAQLNATANVSGTFVYTPAAGTVLKAGTQTLSAVFTPTDTTTYSAATATVQLTVNQATPTITWAAPAAIAQGTALSPAQLNATANVPGTFVYNPAAGNVPAAGTLQLAATFTPTDTTDYGTATAKNALVVNAASNPTPTNPPLTGCGGPTINLNSSMSPSTLSSTIASAPSCALILFAAGSYSLTSTVNVPCGVSLSGPVVPLSSFSPDGHPHLLYGPTAIISATASPVFSYGTCSKAAALEYLEVNTNRPTSGGQVVYATNAGGVNNLTISYNYFHGNNWNGSGECYGCELILFDGNGTPAHSNDTVSWNRLGASGDCAGVMSNFSYGGFTGDGGYCTAVGWHNNMSNFTVSNNFIYYQEEGIKGHEGPIDYNCVNCLIQANDISNFHRIAIETQEQGVGGGAATGTVITFQYNSIHDPYLPGNGTFGISSNNGYQNTPGNNKPSLNTSTSNDLSNVVIDNVGVAAGSPNSWVGLGIEFWSMDSSSVGSNNLIQGQWVNSFMVGTDGAMTASNNHIQSSFGWGGSNTPANCNPYTPGSYGWWNQERSPANTPTGTGNQCDFVDGSLQTSATPAISPASGSFSGSQVVTFTDVGNTSGVGPLGNTGIWYTTDGSTPVPGSGTANYLSTGGTITLTTTTTVKAVGMWGAANQPANYPTGPLSGAFGYGPSAVVTATYTAAAASVVKQPSGNARSALSGTDTVAATEAAGSGAAAGAELASIAVVPAQATVAIGSTTQLKAVATFSDGSTKDVTMDFDWTSSNTRTITASSSGLLSGLATGKATITGSYQGHQASVPAVSTIGQLDWSGPIVITEAGTYSGNWQSTDSKTPAVTVATTAPVVIENAHICSVAGLIKTSVAGADLTVRNSVGLALNPPVKGQANGVFLDASAPSRLDVENNYVENAGGGVLVHGYSGNRDGQQTIVIRANRARNLNGLLSDGNGGYLPGVGSNRSVSRFIELDKVQAVPGIDVGWNEVINYPGHSLVADNIAIKSSSGTPNQPLEIHDTYIQGAYPYTAAQADYAGGGIKTEGSPDDSAQQAPAFNSIHDNQVVGTVNYGIEFTAGHDNIAANNRVISSGMLADGTRIAAQHVGMANGDLNSANSSLYNNSMHDNLIGWTCWTSSCSQSGYRKDQSFPASPGDYSTNSVLEAQPITPEMENNEYQIWLNKMASASIAVGPAF